MKCGILFDSGNYWMDYVGKCSDESAIEIGKSYEYLDISNSDVEFTFIDVCLQSYFLKSCKDFSYIGLVFFLRVTIDQDVVNIRSAKFV